MSEKRVNKLLDSETWEAMKAMGYSEQELLEEQPTGPIISSYTRQQAIEDGTLVDLSQSETLPLVRQAGFKCPVAMTATAFSEAVCPIGGTLPSGQDLLGRLWDVLQMLRHAIRSGGRDTDRVFFSVRVWNGTTHDEVKLWALIGPGDQGEPVMTVMLEGED